MKPFGYRYNEATKLFEVFCRIPTLTHKRGEIVITCEKRGSAITCCKMANAGLLCIHESI